jgi:polyhydroxyalkanoate synthase
MSSPDPFSHLWRDTARLQEQGRAALRQLQELGDVAVGLSEKTLIHSAGKVKLYRYAPLARPRGLPPLLISYAMVNRPYILDLQPDRSLIRELLFLGLDIYLIDWGYADGADRFVPLDQYICGYLDGCVQAALEHSSAPRLNLLGICQGGTFSLCYTALHSQFIANLVTMVTPVDFKSPENLLSKWVQHIDLDLLTQSGNVSGDFLNLVFLALMPFRLTQQKYVKLLQMESKRADLENFMRMEKWIFDSPDQPARALREFAQWFYKDNRLLRGDLVLDSNPVRLDQIKCPVLNIVARQDHLVPPSASVPLGAHVGSSNYELLEVDVGHIGIYVSSKSCKTVPAAIAQWLDARR